MAIQWGKMILHGLLNAVFYIGLPLGLIYLFDYLNIITFTEDFKISILVFGIVGTVISMLKHAFPKDTSANRLMAFFISIYSGIFLFYIFGGFDPSTKLGTYYIDMTLIRILLGLKVIAWLLLASTAIRSLQYLVEAIELRKGKEYNVQMKRKFRLSKVFKAFGFLMSLVIMGYFASVVYSGMNLNFNIHELQPSDLVWDHGSNPDPDYSDDTLNITLTFDILNNGIYAIYNINMSIDLYTEDTEFPLLLDEYTKIGSAPNRYYGTIHSFSQILDQEITIIINGTHAGGLIVSDATLRLEISFETVYAFVYIDLSLSLVLPWTALV